MNKKVRLISYGTKYNIELKADIYYSCKRFPNPHNEYPNLNGLDEVVKEYVLNDECRRFIIGLLCYILIKMKDKQYNDLYPQGLTIAFSCYGGKHRSVVVVEELAFRLREKGYEVGVEHRDLDK